MSESSSPAPTPPETPKPVPPPEPFSERLAAVLAHRDQNRNPLLEAARPLLRAQADMPDSIAPDYALVLRDLLEAEVRTFEGLCTQSNIRRDHMIGARYCLCTALDEAAMRALGDGKDGNAWAARMLATTFHEDTEGGVKVYLLIGRLMQEPEEHLDLLQVIFRILNCGFMGRYRYETDGNRKHETVRKRLGNEVISRRPQVPISLSPNWKPHVQGRRMSFYDFPVWITVVVLSLILLGMYGYDKYRLMARAAEVQKQIADIARMTPRPVTPTLHLKQLLAGEIAVGTVSVDEDAHHSAVTFRGDAMFPPGAVSVNAAMAPLIAKIASEIAKVPGKVTVLGYTDNVPIRSRQFASNEALSEERASQVMRMLQSAGVPASRLEAIGRGDADPVGDNRTAQGRAQNRRVQISVVE